jgi:hypothetical protein
VVSLPSLVVYLVLWYSTNGMKNYRWDSVGIEKTRGIPVLLACTPEEADGVAVHVESEEEAKRVGCVREVGPEALSILNTSPAKFGKRYGELAVEDRTRLFGILLLAKAIMTRDEKFLELAVARLSEGPFSAMRRKIIQSQPAIELGKQIALGLRGIEFILWRKDTEHGTTIAPGLRCLDIKSAIYALALLRIEGGEGLGVCVVCGEYVQPVVDTSCMSKRSQCPGSGTGANNDL